MKLSLIVGIATTGLILGSLINGEVRALTLTKVVHKIPATSLTEMSQTGIFGQYARPSMTIAQIERINLSLTGQWKCDDGGIYYIRQVGEQVWWYGQSDNDGASWSNVFRGRIQGNRVMGQWADVPKGNNRGAGEMLIQITSIDRFRAIDKTGSSFGGSEWTRL